MPQARAAAGATAGVAGQNRVTISPAQVTLGSCHSTCRGESGIFLTALTWHQFSSPLVPFKLLDPLRLCSNRSGLISRVYISFCSTNR